MDIDEERYVCPLLDGEDYSCNARNVDCFDCRTWPFYVMRDDDGQTSLTLSNDCPVASERVDNDAVRSRIFSHVAPYMVNAVENNPGLIVDFRPEVTVITPVTISKR